MITKFTLTAAVIFAAVPLHAATPGFDSAGDPIYGGSGAGSFDGKDGGTPVTFGPWSVIPNPPGTTTAGSFIGDSTTLAPNSSGGNINTSGASFGLFGHSGAYVNAFRSFDAPLLVGQTFSIQIAVNFRNGNKGVDVRDANNNVIFDLNVGGDFYTVNNTGGATTHLFNDDYDPNTVFSIQLTQTSATGGLWTITRSGGLSGTQSGTLFGYNGIPTSFDLYNVQTTGGGAPEDNLFFNNMQIVPEPATSTFFAASGILVTIASWRRRHSGP